MTDYLAIVKIKSLQATADSDVTSLNSSSGSLKLLSLMSALCMIKGQIRHVAEVAPFQPSLVGSEVKEAEAVRCCFASICTILQ